MFLQLFMIDEVRAQILQVEGIAEENTEDGDDDAEVCRANSSTACSVISYALDVRCHSQAQFGMSPGPLLPDVTKSSPSPASERKEYNLGVLRHTQKIFAFLASSKLQYYTPRSFWKHFRSVESSLRLYNLYCRFILVLIHLGTSLYYVSV